RGATPLWPHLCEDPTEWVSICAGSGVKGGENVMRATSRFLSTAAVAAGMTALLVGAGLAQNATPTAMPGTRATPAAMAQAELGPFASHLHSGSCSNLGAEVARLADLQLPAWVGAMAGGTA